jgi:hypothetical protein
MRPIQYCTFISFRATEKETFNTPRVADPRCFIPELETNVSHPGSQIRNFCTPDPSWKVVCNFTFFLLLMFSRAVSVLVKVKKIWDPESRIPDSGEKITRSWIHNTVANQDPGPGAFYPDFGSRGDVFWWDFKNPCSFIFLLIGLVPETIRNKKKVEFIFLPSLCTVGSGMKL